MVGPEAFIVVLQHVKKPSTKPSHKNKLKMKKINRAKSTKTDMLIRYRKTVNPKNSIVLPAGSG